MMFKEQELNSYRSIKAPQELYDKVMAAQKPKVHWSRYATGLVAACLVLAMGIGFFFRGGEPGIIINGQLLDSSVVYHDLAPAAELRTSEVLTVPVELELSGRSRIRVTQGVITLNDLEPTDELTASGTVTLLWEVPRGASECEMHIESGRTLTTLTLEYGETQITITKKGE
jgi:hypothetical protein